MKLIYNVKDKPKFGQLIVFAIQQLLAIMAATLVVPVIINGKCNLTNSEIQMSPSAALFGAGIGTLIYVLFTQRKSPVFLGSSFAFLESMAAAFAGATTVYLGFVGLIIGAIFAGLVYVIIAIIVKYAGVSWIDKLMPAVVIGPTVAIIGLSLAGNAVDGLTTGSVKVEDIALASPLITILCGLVTLIVAMLCSTYGKKTSKLIPFIIGIIAGYAFAAILTSIGNAADIDILKITDFEPFESLLTDGHITLSTFVSVPKFTFLTAFTPISSLFANGQITLLSIFSDPGYTLHTLAKALGDINASYIGTIAVAYVPVAFVVFAEHIADHKNISSIIETDLLKDPGLSRTLLGDGIGSMAGAFFGGCPNTTYGESIGCVAITKNASVYSIIAAAVGAIAIAFLSPFVAFVNTIPGCVMGGVCMALYGFIAVSGLKMVQSVDLNQNKNLFVVSTILIAGIGGLTVSFGQITITEVACALILGIIVNLILHNAKEEA